MKTPAKIILVIAMFMLFGIFLAVMVKNSNESTERAEQQVAQEQRENMELVKQHQVRVGMTTAQVLEAWGEPGRTSRTLTARHRSDHWVYEWSSKTDYLYFHDGVLHSMQNSR